MRFHHFAIEVNELSASKAFYETMLGFKECCRLIFQGEEILFLELEGFRLELLQKKQAAPLSEHVHLCFEVECLHEKIIELRNKQLIPDEGPYKLDNGWSTVFYRGPENEIIEFIQTKPKK